MDVIELDCHSTNTDYSPGPRGVKRSRSNKILSHPRIRQQTPPEVSSASSASEASEASGDAMPPQRYAGDGLDYRRPVSASAQENTTDIVLIDLTTSNEEEGGDTINSIPRTRTRRRDTGRVQLRTGDNPPHRAPRYDRQIFNLEDDPEQSTRPRLGLHSHGSTPPAPMLNHARSTPDWMQTRQLPRLPNMPEQIRGHPRLRRSPSVPHPRDDAQHGTRGTQASDVIILDADEPEVSFLYERQTAPRVTLPSHRPAPNPSRTAAILARQNAGRTTAALWGYGATATQQLFDFTRPAFDYFAQGLQTQTPGFTPEPPRRPMLAPCSAGFTRSPREGDYLICPCCGIELCTEDGDTAPGAASELWMIKTCGHVYCGSCARNRPKKGNRRSKAPPKPNQFTTCCADDCKEQVTGSSTMVQLFL